MTRRVKLWSACGVTVMALSVAAVLVLRSDWFSGIVRDRIAFEAGKATGGRVEIGSFHFDWRTLRVDLGELVIHGSEPSSGPPLLRVASVTFTLKLAPLLRGNVDMDAFEAVEPRAHLLIDPSGQTNLPGPPPSQRSQTFINIAIQRFTVKDGEFDVNSSRNPWSATGANFRTVFRQEAGSRYAGAISIEPLELRLSQDLPITLHVKSSFTVGKNQIAFSNTALDTAESHAELSGTIQKVASPQSDFQYKIQLSLGEASRVLKMRGHQTGMIEVEGFGHFAGAADYVATGRLHATHLSFGDGARAIRDVTADSAVRLDPLRIELPRLRMEALGGSFSGQAEVTGLDRFHMIGDVVGMDLARLVSLYGSRPAPWTGVLAGSVDVHGLLSQLYLRRFQAKAQMVISPAGERNPVRGAIDANYDGERGLLELADSHLALPSTQLDFAGVLGRQLRVRVKSTNLDDFAPALEGPLPISLDHGAAAFDGTVNGALEAPQIAGRVSLENFIYDRQKFQAFAADVALDESSAQLQRASLKRGGWQAEFDGKTSLANWQFNRAAAMEARVSARGAKLSEIAALAGRSNIPVEGGFKTNAKISGTIQDPHLDGDLSLAKGTLYGEPFDALNVKLQYAANRLQIGSGVMQAGPRRVSFDASYQHAAGDYGNGRLTLHATGNRMALNQIQTVRNRWPEVSGEVQFTGGGTFTVTPAELRPEDLTADLTGFSVAMDGKPLGDVRLTAATRNGSLEAKLDMPLAGSAVRAEGHWRLAGEYPGTVEASFSKLDFAKLAAWANAPEALRGLNGWTEGKLTLTGPAMNPEAWTGSLDLPKIEISAVERPAGSPDNGAPLTLHNSAPVRLTLEKSLVRVESARLAGRNTDFSVTGTAALTDTNALNGRVEGSIDLAMLRDFSPSLNGSGQMAVDAAIRGPLRQPQITGRTIIKNASLTVADFPNGLTQINGAILFEGTRATIRDVTAETGGGKVTLAGFVSVAAKDPTFRIDATAAQVRLRYPEGASTVADAALTWTGSSQRNVLSGTVTILRTGLNRRTDFSSLFGRAAEPARAVANPTGLLAGLQFDVQIETAQGVSFQTSLAQNLQADANLRLRGTLTNPVLLGRINITQGEMTFFGNKYTISQGSVSFYNPVKLEPNLNLDLQTRARGIDITLSVSGPINKLNVNYRSDPPLQFSDIVALLATGRAPSTDPAVQARQTGAAQSWQQAGASALVGQALSSPGGGRLERFFGVSKIKIDPLLTGVDSNPQARVTIEQPVTQDVTLTYLTNLTRTNSAFVRVEWSLNREWSVIAVREENSAFGVDLQFKKRFK